METLYRTGLNNALSATVLALAVACLGLVLRRRPAVMHCLWVLVLVKLVTPPLYEVSVPWARILSTPRETVLAADIDIRESEHETVLPPNCDDVLIQLVAGMDTPNDRPIALYGAASIRPVAAIDWTQLAWLIWITGTVMTLVLSIWRTNHFQHVLRQAEPADDDTQEWVAELAASLGLGRPPSVWWIAGRISPMVWPVGWRPRLVLPRELWEGLDDRQRAALIIHELAHLRRGDHHLRFFELVVTALYWWHPVVWWARRALHDVEEQSCDAWVVWALPGAVKAYADTLLDTLDFLNQCDRVEPLLASGFGKVAHLRKRLTMIMSGPRPRLLGIWGTFGTLAAAVLLLPLNASWAQTPEVTEDVRIVVESDTAATTSVDDLATIVKDDQKDVRIVVKSDAAATASVDDLAKIVKDGQDVVAQVVTIESKDPGRYDVVVKSDGATPVVAAGSLDEVIKTLNDEIEKIAKKSPQTEHDKAHREALERVLRDLKKSASKSKDPKHGSRNIKLKGELHGILVPGPDMGKGLSAEKKAEIEQAQAKVEAIVKDLHSKQKELAEARTKLTKLMIESRKPMIDGFAKSAMPKPGMPPLRYAVTRSPDPSKKRIEDLEKKLDKLLDEVTALKKNRSN